MPAKKRKHASGAGRPRTLTPGLDKRFNVRCSESDFERWEAHAQKIGLSGAGQWLRKLANDALAQPAKAA